MGAWTGMVCPPTSMKLLLTLTLLLTISGLAHAQWFCKGRECPDFTEEDAEGYTVRTYPNTLWVGTNVTLRAGDDMEEDDSTRTMFRKLFSYIRGENTEDEEIDMTTPVITRYEALDNGDVKVAQYFYLARDNAPLPTDEDVFLYRSPEDLRLMVKSFNSFFWMPSKAKYGKYVEKLMEAVDAAGMDFKANIYYHVSYDGPFALVRHNEVWVEPMEPEY